jgi:hypothetical protein
MPTCDDLLAGDFANNCSHKPKQGLNRKFYFNWKDVDRAATTITNKGTKVTNLVLKSGAKIYEVTGNRKTLKAKHALAVLDFGNGYIHTDTFSILYNGEDERQRVQELVNMARVCSLVEKVDTGNSGELTYEIYGLESGMSIIEDNYDSSANSGASIISVATEKGEEESTGKKLFLMSGGVSAVETWITANLYVAS